MLWQPWRSMTRRQAKRTGTDDAVLPSWSWAGWQGVIQTESWRSAAIYQLSNDNDEAPDQQCSWKTISTIQWSWSHTLTSARQPIHVPSEHARPDLALRTDELPSGWSRVDPPSGAGPKLYRHVRILSQLFRFPIPLCSPMDAPQPVINARYIHCKTRRAFLKPGRGFRSWCSNCFAIELQTSSGRWAGVLRLPNTRAKVEVHMLMLGGKRNQNERTDCEVIELSAGSVQNQTLDDKTFDEWESPECPRHQGLYEFINVMWIEREGGVAYRRALGRVEAKTWGRLAKETINISLG
jgi:hypothetical protein